MSMADIFTQTYPIIERSAKLITRSRKASEWRDLINTTYLCLHSKPLPTAPDEFVKFFGRSMKIEHAGAKSSFNTRFRFIYDDINEGSVTDKSDKCLIEKNKDEVSVLKKSLPLHEQVLYDLYFIADLTTEEIYEQLNAEGYDIPIHRVYTMIRDMKKRVRKWSSILE